MLRRQNRKIASLTPLCWPFKDRAYQYDHAGRLKEAYSGTQARDFVNSTNVGTADGPYRQTSSYDAWDNLLSGGGRFWSRNVVDTASYNQFNRNPNWNYDAEGNLISRNESFAGTLPAQNRYDAAGRRSSVTQTRPCMLEPQHLLQLHIYTNTQTHDGDGQVTGYEQVHTIGINGPPAEGSPTKTFYLRSSVLGGRVVSEYEGSNISAAHSQPGCGCMSKIMKPKIGDFQTPANSSECDAHAFGCDLREKFDRNGSSSVRLPYFKEPGKNPYLPERVPLWKSEWEGADRATLAAFKGNLDRFLSRPKKAGGYGLTPTSTTPAFKKGTAFPR